VAYYQNPAAFWGAFLAIIIDEQIPILFSPNLEQTSLLLSTIFKRQRRKRGEYGLRHKPKMLSLEEKQKFVVQGLPEVGEILSRSLLEHFGSVRNVMKASQKELMKVPMIGQVKALEIGKVLDSKYRGTQKRLTEEK